MVSLSGIPDATATGKGKVQLAGALNGTAASPGINFTNANHTHASAAQGGLLGNPYKFRAYRAAAANSGNAAFATIVMDTKNFDTGTNFSTTTGQFTAPVAGFYQFNGRGSLTTSAGRCVVALFKNGTTEVSRGADVTVATGNPGSSVSDILQLSAADTIELKMYSNTTNALDLSQATNYLSGFLVSAT